MKNQKSDKKTEIPKKTISEKPYTNIILANIIFWIFCIIQLMIIWIIVGEGAGLIYFFAFLCIAFSFVSVFDLIFDKYKSSRSAEDR